IYKVDEGTAKDIESTAEVIEVLLKRSKYAAAVCESTASVIRYLRTYCLLYQISGNT
ncbi:hypothetical protein Tco_0423783, partial [Tanacetum coccineum]